MLCEVIRCNVAIRTFFIDSIPWISRWFNPEAVITDFVPRHLTRSQFHLVSLYVVAA